MGCGGGGGTLGLRREAGESENWGPGGFPAVPPETKLVLLVNAPLLIFYVNAEFLRVPCGRPGSPFPRGDWAPREAKGDAQGPGAGQGSGPGPPAC